MGSSPPAIKLAARDSVDIRRLTEGDDGPRTVYRYTQRKAEKSGAVGGRAVADLVGRLHQVEAVVVDEDACGALASAVLWVADDDGEAAGPVEVSPASASLVAGSATQGDTAVQISATDCAGDPAAGGLLHARATLGVLLSGSSTLFSTGDGLAFNLDGSGEANLTWSVQGDRHAGTPTLHVGRPTEESYGAAEVVVTGDAALPVVVDVAPVGTSSATFSEVSVDFSEPMLTGSVSASSAALFDPLGANPSVVRSLSADRQTLTLTLAAPRDAGHRKGGFGRMRRLVPAPRSHPRGRRATAP